MRKTGKRRKIQRRTRRKLRGGNTIYNYKGLGDDTIVSHFIMNNPLGLGLDKVNNVFQNSVGIDPVKPFEKVNEGFLSKFKMDGVMTDIDASKSEAETNAKAREAAEVAEKTKKEAAEAELAKVKEDAAVAVANAKKEADDVLVKAKEDAAAAAKAKTELEELKKEISKISKQRGGTAGDKLSKIQQLT
jgi:hypothetical protein